MKTGTFFFTLCACVVLNGCTSWVVRTDYNLNHSDSLVFSDSEVQNGQPKNLGDGKISVPQTILIENISRTATYVLHPERSSFVVNKDPFPTNCVPFRAKPGELRLAPGQKSRLDCETVVVSNFKNQLRNRDSVGTLIIPYDGAGKILSFGYYLKVEDFQ